MLLGPALGIGSQLPGLYGGLDRLALLIVANPVEDQLPLALDRTTVDGAGLEVGPDGVAGPVVAPFEPAEDLEGASGDQNLTGTDHGATAGVADLGGHFVAVVKVGV